MLRLEIPCPAPFHFRDVVFAHGWLRLSPFHWDAATETLARPERLPSGAGATLRIQGRDNAVILIADTRTEDGATLSERLRWMLALEDDLGAFHAMCREDPGLRAAGERGRGRILRSPTVWEDLVKTLFSVNTTWRQTISMTRNLVSLYGTPVQSPDADGTERGALFHTFPEPGAIARLEPGTLQERCRVGYRAEPLVLLARGIAEGRLDLEALKEPALPDEEVESRLRSLRGIGPYAAANVMMLLGRYDHLPVDSWFRKTVRDGWFGGRPVPDRELVAAFDRYRPFRTLVYRFYDWEGAMRTEVWCRGSE